MLNYDGTSNQSKTIPIEVEQLELKDTDFNVAFGIMSFNPFKVFKDDDLKGYITLKADVLNWDFRSGDYRKNPLSFRQCTEDDL